MNTCEHTSDVLADKCQLLVEGFRKVRNTVIH
jgi:hypothetical protein